MLTNVSGSGPLDQSTRHVDLHYPARETTSKSSHLLAHSIMIHPFLLQSNSHTIQARIRFASLSPPSVFLQTLWLDCLDTSVT